MLSDNPESVEQTMLKEYLSNLKRKLKRPNMRVSILDVTQRDFLPYKNRIHYFADQCLLSAGESKPYIDLEMIKRNMEKFVEQSNRDFRTLYSKLRAMKLHTDMNRFKVIEKRKDMVA